MAKMPDNSITDKGLTAEPVADEEARESTLHEELEELGGRFPKTAGLLRKVAKFHDK